MVNEYVVVCVLPVSVPEIVPIVESPSNIGSPQSDGSGLGKFQYSPPSGYYAICTKNINTYG